MGRVKGNTSLSGRSPLLLGLCLLVLLLNTPPAMAENGDTDGLHADEKLRIQRLQIMVRTQSILHEMGETAARDIEQKGALTDAEWEQRLMEAGRRVLFEHLDEKEARAHRSRAWEILKKLHWKSMVGAIKGLGGNVKKAWRVHGVPGVASLVSTVVLNAAVPTVLSAMGLPHLIPFSVAAPYGSTAYTAAYALQQRRLRKELAKLYGGEAEYQKVQAAQNEVRERLGVKGLNEMIVPMFSSEHGFKGAVVAPNSMLSNLMARLGWSERKLTYENLVGFLKKWDAKDPFVEAIVSNPRWSKELKTAVLLTFVNSYPDRGLIAKLHATFSKSFVELTPLSPTLTEPIHAWLDEFARIRSPAEISRMMLRAPEGLKTGTMARIWSEILLPLVIENMPGISSYQSEQLSKQFASLFAKAQLARNANWDDGWKREFDKYLMGALPSAANCFSVGWGLDV